MLVLFDGTPRTLARYLIDRHTVTEAEAAAFEVLLTTDKGIRYLQNLVGRKIAIVVLGKGRWSLIKPHVAKVAAAVSAATPGSYTEVEIPFQ
jgi:hypothetical protein